MIFKVWRVDDVMVRHPDGRVVCFVPTCRATAVT